MEYEKQVIFLLKKVTKIYEIHFVHNLEITFLPETQKSFNQIYKSSPSLMDFHI